MPAKLYYSLLSSIKLYYILLTTIISASTPRLLSSIAAYSQPLAAVSHDLLALLSSTTAY